MDDARSQNLSSRQKAEKEAYQAEFDAMQSDVLRIVSYVGKTKELREQQWKDEQAAIDKMKEGSDKRIRQIRLNYEKEIAEINEQEARLRAAQGGTLTKEQSQGFVQSYAEAHGRMENGVRDVEGNEVAKGKKNWKLFCRNINPTTSVAVILTASIMRIWPLTTWNSHG